LWVLVVGSVLVTALTLPTIPGFGSRGRLDTGDGRFSIWNVGWIDHALLTSPAHLFDANIFYPHTGTLAYSELNLVAGVLGLPAFVWTRNAIAALNEAVAGGLLLAFVCMWALVRRLTGSSTAGLVSATAFVFCPYVQVHTAHIQLLMIFGFPLTFLAYHRLREGSAWWRGALELGAALAVTALACAYYGVYGGLALALFALVMARARRAYWAALVGAVVVAVVLVAPVFVPYQAARAASGASRLATPADMQSYSATLAMYASSPAHAHAWLFKESESVFPGFLLIGLAGLGLAATLRGPSSADRRVAWAYLGVAAFAVWASFGPRAHLYLWLADVVPWMTLLRAPVRFGVIVAFALAVLAGFGVRRVASRRAWMGWLLVPAVALELAAVPWPLAQAGPVPEAYRLLATLPRGPVVEFPFMYKSSDFHNQTRYMFNSIYHWQPLVNGYSDLIPPDFQALAIPINAFPDPGSFELMRQYGVRYVVVHLDRYDSPWRERLLARFPPYAAYLQRLTTDRNTWLYEIVAWPPRDQAR
jgi:hypothetical protein